jgi:hypothetical protein
MNVITVSPVRHPRRPFCRICNRQLEYGEVVETYQNGSKTAYQCQQCSGKNVSVAVLKITTRCGACAEDK